MIAPANKDRERWTSRLAFYFAAIGSAVSFGNVWRFPSLVYEYGGGAFFIPYVAALILIGLPILLLEISLGQYYETGDVNVFGGIHKRLRGVGLSSIACGYMLVTYYSMLIAWVVHSFFDSFGNNFWAQPHTTGNDATAYFYNEIIGANTLGPDGRPTRLVWANVGYSFFTWVIVFLCIAFGIKWTGRVAYFTMGLPIVLLFVFLRRAVTLPGSGNGIDEYIKNTDWSVLTDKPEVWPKAVSQIFFSLSVTFGIMTAYGSHCPREERAFMNSCVIAFSNSLFSFVAGFAVFAALGHLATLENLESVKQLNYSGFGLAFGSWPVVLGTLSGGTHWIRLFFVMLFLLGIDSAFSFMEGFMIAVSDVRLFQNVNKKYISFGLSITAWLLSLVYATDAGLEFLDTIDYYINFVMLLVGGFECFAAGWIYNIEEQIDCLGVKLVFTYMIATFGSLTVACILGFSLGEFWIGAVGFIMCYALVGMPYVAYLMKKCIYENPGYTWRSMCYDLMLRNVMDLKTDLQGVVGYIPSVWAILIKHFIPSCIIVLFALGCSAKNTDGKSEFGHYGGYPTAPFQILGIFVVVFAGFIFFSSLLVPQMYDMLQKIDSPIKKPPRNQIFAEPIERKMWSRGQKMNRSGETVVRDLESQNSTPSSPVDAVLVEVEGGSPIDAVIVDVENQ